MEKNKEFIFPEGFWWGSASSGPQMEGASEEDGKGKSIFDHYFDLEPNRFFNEVGPSRTCDFYHRYKEDIAYMKEIGLNSYRFSIQWSRLIPNGIGEVNKKAVDFYNNVINEMIDNGVEPFVNLFHFDMPLSMQEIGGWESRAVVDAYVRYARIAFDLFGDRVKTWFTFNEPIIPVEQGYLYDAHYPNVVDGRRAAQVAFNSMLAQAKAVREFRDSNCKGGKIGTILNLSPTYPRSKHKQDVKAANIADLIFNRSFLDPSVKGEYPAELIELLKEWNALPKYEEEDLNIIRNNIVDLLGVNYYFPRRVKAKIDMINKEAPLVPEMFFDNHEMPGRKINKYRGWEIYEKGIYDILTNLKENYNNIECYISENGMGVEDEGRFKVDGVIQDDYRIEFIKDHLRWLHKAIEEGSNCRGYHLWTFIDNWSWLNAYKNRYGLIELDLDTLERHFKKSGYWMRNLIKNNRF